MKFGSLDAAQDFKYSGIYFLEIYKFLQCVMHFSLGQSHFTDFISRCTKKWASQRTITLHSTSGLPPHGGQHPLGGTEVGCQVGLRRAARGWPPLNLLFYPLACLCTY